MNGGGGAKLFNTNISFKWFNTLFWKQVEDLGKSRNYEPFGQLEIKAEKVLFLGVKVTFFMKKTTFFSKHVRKKI